MLYDVDKTCHTNCPSYSFTKDNLNCYKCHTDCLTCSDSNNNNCSSCIANKFLYKNECIPSCKVSTYVIKSNHCIDCP